MKIGLLSWGGKGTKKLYRKFSSDIKNKVSFILSQTLIEQIKKYSFSFKSFFFPLRLNK
jgi:hypothetical protein